MNLPVVDVTANRLLASLPSADRSRLAPLLTPVMLERGRVLAEPGERIEYAWFPCRGMISLLVVMRDGRAVETATVGSDGVVGGMAGLGLDTMLTRAAVQVPISALRIAAVALRREVAASTALRDAIVTFNETLLAQVQVTAACNALHPLRARLARWILQTRDYVEGDLVPLTQELLAEMLGVRRSSVSEIAAQLQVAGLIRYRRGMIEILDRPALEQASCECRAYIQTRTLQMAETLP